MGGQGGTSTSTSSAISTWVAANDEASTVDGVTIYDLTASAKILGLTYAEG